LLAILQRGSSSRSKFPRFVLASLFTVDCSECQARHSGCDCNAAELARVTVWIGDIHWCRRNGYPHAVNRILKQLYGIEHRDVLLNPDGSEADWPTADVIVGKPPFLGGSVMRGDPGAADLVT